MKNNVEKLIYKMLTESTGKALCDSGDTYGRNWEKNQKKTLKDFQNDPKVSFEDGYYTISLFHYLVKGLELNELCQVFNRKKVNNWESDIYGVSDKGHDLLIHLGFTVERTFNSYNGFSALSQVIQGTWLDLNGNKYLLLQIHQGCDVRGGYTDAKLFYVPEYENGVLMEDVYGTLTKKNGETLTVDNTNNEIEVQEGDVVSLTMAE